MLMVFFQLTYSNLNWTKVIFMIVNAWKSCKIIIFELRDMRDHRRFVLNLGSYEVSLINEIQAWTGIEKTTHYNSTTSTAPVLLKGSNIISAAAYVSHITAVIQQNDAYLCQLFFKIYDFSHFWSRIAFCTKKCGNCRHVFYIYVHHLNIETQKITCF